MTETDRWLSEYGASHSKMRNAPVYWLAVPIVVLGVVGLMWSVPVPEEFRTISPILNWGTAFLLAAVVYYFIISLPLAIGMLPFVAAVIAFHLWLEHSGFVALRASVGMTAAGVVGLYMGHYRDGGLRAVLHDIQLLMIAPIWLLSVLYRRLGIPH